MKAHTNLLRFTLGNVV